jgi:RNA polymerase sigma factor (sigma-70 family)
MNDAELLQEYASDNSQAAFQTLVERHLPLVYSVALRQVGDSALAENISHVVFILLARKSDQLAQEAILPDWLFHSTLEVVGNSLRGKQNHQLSKQKAQQFHKFRPIDTWERVVDNALVHLGNSERAALLLHYFQFKRVAEVALELGINEDAAQKIIERATRKMCRLLSSRGVDLPETVLPGLFMTRGALSPPSDLMASVTAAAVGQVAFSTPVYALLQDGVRESIWPKLSASLRGAAALAVIVGLAVHFWPRKPADKGLAFSLDSKVVMRPPYEPPPAELQVSEPTKILEVSADKAVGTTPTNAPKRIAVLQPTPANNIVWPPETLANLTTMIPGPSDSADASMPITQPEPESAPPPVVWNPSISYPPVGVSAGFVMVAGTNLSAPWPSAQRATVAVPAGSAPFKPAKRK